MARQLQEVFDQLVKLRVGVVSGDGAAGAPGPRNGFRPRQHHPVEVVLNHRLVGGILVTVAVLVNDAVQLVADVHVRAVRQKFGVGVQALAADGPPENRPVTREFLVLKFQEPEILLHVVQDLPVADDPSDLLGVNGGDDP